VACDRIRRAVVDQENFEVRVRLVEDALDGIANVSAEVVAWDDDRDGRRVSAHRSLP